MIRWRTLFGPGLLALSLSPSLSATPPGAEPLRLPIRIIQSNPVTTIAVGDRTVEAVVDTGGGGIELSEEVIREAGGIRMTGKQKGTDAYGRKSVASKFRIPSLTIGGRRFKDVVVTQAEAGREGEGPPVANSIGRHFLHKYFVVIDYAGSSINLWSPDAKAASGSACGTRPIRMERTKDSNLVVSKFTTPSGSLRLVWDTGATYSVLNKTLAMDRQLETTAQGETFFYRPPTLFAAGQEFGPVEFVLLPVQPPEGSHGFLGANFFSNHVVCLDYRKREILVR